MFDEIQSVKQQLLYRVPSWYVPIVWSLFYLLGGCVYDFVVNGEIFAKHQLFGWLGCLFGSLYMRNKWIESLK